MSTPRTCADLLRLFDDPHATAALAPSLHVDGPDGAIPVGAVPSVGEDVAREGYAVVADVVPRPTCDALFRGIEELERAGLPALFVIAYDELWSATFAVANAVSRALGRPLVIIPDLWAWLVRPAPGARGWGPHRGFYEPVIDASGLPALVDVWIPLLDVTPENGCMVVVPQDLDPGFPTSKRVEDTPLDRARALPATAGSAAFWGANVLHWGGTIGRRAPAPRAAFSVTLRAPESERLAEFPPIRSRPSFAERVDLLAQVIETYHALDPSLGVVLEWARAHRGLTMARRKLRRPSPTA